MNLKFYTSEAEELKLKVRKFCGLIPTFVKVTGEKLVGPSILNSAKNAKKKKKKKKKWKG